MVFPDSYHPLPARSNPQLPAVFKGIVLLTPGGDLVYAIDPSKTKQWHLQLCSTLQEWLGLSEPPHFLVPCYTATVDRWLNPNTQKIHIAAEAYPLVWRYRAFFSTLFALDPTVWQQVPWQEGACEPMVIATYRAQFPQLWENHELVVRLELPGLPLPEVKDAITDPGPSLSMTSGYFLRLFVAGLTPTTERTLQFLHEFLERSLRQPYTLKVIDIYQHPEQAEADQVAATPTLVRVWPQPVRRIVGEIDRVEKVLPIL
jgi:circadian clock protein KaiB